MGDRIARRIRRYRGTAVFSMASSMICSLRVPAYLALVSGTMRWARTETARARMSSGVT
jgi:hypothetical protein